MRTDTDISQQIRSVLDAVGTLNTANTDAEAAIDEVVTAILPILAELPPAGDGTGPYYELSPVYSDFDMRLYLCREGLVEMHDDCLTEAGHPHAIATADAMQSYGTTYILESLVGVGDWLAKLAPQYESKAARIRKLTGALSGGEG